MKPLHLIVLTLVLLCCACGSLSDGEQAISAQVESTATDVSTPRPTNTPVSIATSTPLPIPTETPTLEPTNTSTPEPTMTNTPTPDPTETPTSIATNTATPTEAPTSEPTPTSTSLPTATPTTVPSPTPQPTATPIPQANTLTIVDFSLQEIFGQWYIVNDTVMGGVSTANGKVENDYLIFDGNLSLDNNGGFTSIRRQMTSDLTDYSGIRLRLRGDGRSYYFRMAELAGGREVSHEILFQTIADTWIDVELPFDQYIPNFRGFPIDQPMADRSNLRDINFMLREKNPGYFRLDIAKVEAYR